MITSINIQTANHSIVEAIRAIIALDPETTITYDNEDYLSQADQQDLKKLVEADKRGELKYQAFDEFKTEIDRKSTRLNSSHMRISYAVFCLKKKKR